LYKFFFINCRIGFAIARRLALDGASVVISSRKEKNVRRAETELRNEGLDVLGVVCHVADAKQRQNMIKQTVEKFGGIDILVSNAATNPTFGPILDTSESAWDKIFETNVKATFFLCKEIAPLIEQRGGGSIVLVSSVGGYNPSEVIGVYSISKTTLLGMVKALAPQLASMNIRVNCLAPGLIKTKFSQALVQQPEIVEKTLETVPLKRLGEPEDCSGTVSFLVSSDADFITGETILVTGGVSARL